MIRCTYNSEKLMVRLSLPKDTWPVLRIMTRRGTPRPARMSAHHSPNTAINHVRRPQLSHLTQSHVLNIGPAKAPAIAMDAKPCRAIVTSAAKSFTLLPMARIVRPTIELDMPSSSPKVAAMPTAIPPLCERLHACVYGGGQA